MLLFRARFGRGICSEPVCGIEATVTSPINLEVFALHIRPGKKAEQYGK